MSRGPISIHGEVFVTLETVADCYAVEVTLLEEVYALGLLGHGRRVGSEVAVRVTTLGRVARIVQLHVQLGINPPGIARLLEELEE